MCNVASNSDKASILEKAKRLITQSCFDFVPRRKNMQALAKHGLTIKDAKEEILELVISNYYKGPKKDFDKPGEIWEFKKLVNGIQFYIKFKVVVEDGREILRCLGFHDDEFM